MTTPTEHLVDLTPTPFPSAPSSASSPPSAVNASTSPPTAPFAANNPDPNQPRPSRARFRSIPEFTSLSREQLDYVHDLLRTKTYEEAQLEIWTTLGFRISTNRLHRYREAIDLAAALEIAEQDTIPAVNTLNDLLAGRETNIPAAGFFVVQQRALALAASPKTSATTLKDLFRIFTYEDRRKDNAHRRLIAEQREHSRKRMVDLAERKYAEARKPKAQEQLNES